MSTIRIDSERLDEVASLLNLWGTRGATYRNTLWEVIGFKKEDPRSDFVTQFINYLMVIEPEPQTHPKVFDPAKGDELPDDLKEQSHGPVPASAFGLDPLDVTDPISIWQYTRKNLLITEHIAVFMIKSGWDFIDHRKIEKPLTKPPEEVESILIEQKIEQRYMKDCDPKFQGLMELIFKAFHHWWLEDQKKKAI